MYRLIKERSSIANVTLQNTDTSESLIVGRPTIRMLELLDAEGYSPKATDEDKHIDLSDKWNIEISEDTAKILASSTMSMKKPVRVKKDKSEQSAKTSSHDKNQPVDVFNLIFGIED